MARSTALVQHWATVQADRQLAKEFTMSRKGPTTVVLVTLLLCTTCGSTFAESKFQQAIDNKRFCDDLKSAYDTNMDYYNGDPKHRSRWKTTAENLKIVAEANNCGWASRFGGIETLGNDPILDPIIAPSPTQLPHTRHREVPSGINKVN